MSSLSHDGHPSRDLRLEQLEHWLAGLFGARDFAVTPASADASFRRYFRVSRQGQTWIAMDAPPGKEDMGPYIRVSGMLVEVGVNAPKVLQRDQAQGFLLNTDLGSRTYLADLDAGADAERLYRDAIEALVAIQAGAGEHAKQLPAYDDALLRREMGLFPEWFCNKHLGLQLSDAEVAGLASTFDTLVAEALQQPRVFVHRDYHSRNLMVTDGVSHDKGGHGANPGILDFQDAVLGPVTYDLVSLFRDSYVEWPLERVHAWIKHFRDTAQRSGVDVGSNPAQFQRWFDLMGVQRQLKVLGIFARLYHRDGKSGYLKDLPRTLSYVRQVIKNYGDLEFLTTFIEQRIVPAMAKL
ncbi:aminoglycoside phosphotransferase family protein [Steroidobacter sp.]|uniref:aminoglycoside phosphotransferase family protein n=1 Tax=Steroidobacter sp. TaxID=1978227 RepID=UPI001A4E7FE7|nr:phosphotransferase [Steroidobacter sp.]MBL8268976.1 phosphotransferase [Steroidobacter sp.]